MSIAALFTIAKTWEPSKCPSAGEWMKKDQSCPTVGDPMDCSLSGSSVHGVFQECWSGLPFPSPGDLPDPGIEPGSPTLQADTLPSEPPGTNLKLIVKEMEIQCSPETSLPY